MNVAIFCSDFSLVNRFVGRYYDELASQDIFITAVVYDRNDSKKDGFFRHALKVASRQARISRCSIPTAFVRKVVWNTFFDKALRRQSGAFIYSDKIEVKTVGSLNAGDAAKAVKDSRCDIVCLMGARILSQKTIKAVDVPIINIHSSDPRIIRGGPAVFWEIFKGLDHIVLTVHEVTEHVDSGDIWLQGTCPIDYKRSLFSTIRNTMDQAGDVIVRMFRDVLTGFKSGAVQRTSYQPGPLMVTPGIFQMIKARTMCVERSKG